MRGAPARTPPTQVKGSRDAATIRTSNAAGLHASPITSAQTAAQAITLGAAEVINIKPGRVGGFLESRRIHDLAVAHGIPVWCGGMLESGVGRAANLALAALPGFVLPGDTSASDRYYAEDLTEPFVLQDGHVRVPTGPGIGVAPDPERLAAWTVRTVTWTSDD